MVRQWGIGVDTDQWFATTEGLRDHVLTSIIKRHDEAAFLLAEHLLDSGPDGEVASIGLADCGYDYSTRGDAMTTETLGTIERLKTDVAEGRIVVSVRPDGPVLVLDDDGNKITEPPYVEGEPGIDSP